MMNAADVDGSLRHFATASNAVGRMLEYLAREELATFAATNLACDKISIWLRFIEIQTVIKNFRKVALKTHHF